LQGRWGKSAGWRADGAGSASFSVLAVLLLLLATYSIVAMETRDLAGGGNGIPSLGEAEAELRSFLSRALDAAFEEAVPRAATTTGVGLGEAMDAGVVSFIRARVPGTVGGWTLELVDARGGVRGGAPVVGFDGAPSGTAVPYADVRVDLSRYDMPGLEPVRLGLGVEGPPGAIWDDPTRAARIVNALRDPGGPIAYGARNALWQVAQARAFSTLRDAGAIITDEDVVAALEGATSTVVGGLPGVPPAPPAVDIETLVLQSVEGMVERNLGWFDDYLLGVDGLPGLEGA
jgi:hypothetical protein